MTFEEKVARLREFGAVEVEDWFPSTREPYRMALLRSERLLPVAAIAAVADWLAVAFEVEGFFSVHTFNGHGTFSVQTSRPLTAAEVGDNPPAASRAVRS